MTVGSVVLGVLCLVFIIGIVDMVCCQGAKRAREKEKKMVGGGIPPK